MINYIIISSNRRTKLLVFCFVLFSLFVITDIINAFTGIYFKAVDGEYARTDYMIISQGYQFIIFSMVFIVTLVNRRISIREKIAFACYCILPLISIILQNIFKGYAIAYATIIVSVEILFFFVNVQRNVELAKEEEKNKEAQVRIMLSQIQPHFIYNSLSAISTLISIDPEKAQKSLDDFTEYLRRNLSSLTETKLIPFTTELKHIETYISLEKMRFNDRINVIYNIETTDFKVPPLSIQPIVENAIKHGVLKKLEGGTVIISTYETDTSYVIEVKDDGIGFDISSIDFDENIHFGLKNISYRINQACEGDLKVSSKIGVGTKITVTFNK
jgi:sensor histidine kinase YesM